MAEFITGNLQSFANLYLEISAIPIAGLYLHDRNRMHLQAVMCKIGSYWDVVPEQCEGTGSVFIARPL